MIENSTDNIDSEHDKHSDNDSDFLNALQEMADENNKLDLRIISYLLRQKEEVILELRGKVSILSNQLEMISSLLKSNMETNCITSNTDSNNANACSGENTVLRQVESSQSGGLRDISSEPQLQGIGQLTNCNIKPVSINHQQRYGQNGRKPVPSLKASDVTPHSENKEQWTDVVNRRNKNPVIVGRQVKSSDENSTLQLQGVPKMSELHVYRLAPTTTEEQIINFLKPKRPEVICEKLESRNANIYASFKVSVHEEHVESVLSPDQWPQNVCIKRFFHLRNQKPPT
ncbi:hypothetical protein C0J52_13436 [Blattella germanica]|nr:hypothetical protein C0J52_13436 [Blattella germanica]